MASVSFRHSCTKNLLLLHDKTRLPWTCEACFRSQPLVYCMQLQNRPVKVTHMLLHAGRIRGEKHACVQNLLHKRNPSVPVGIILYPLHNAVSLVLAPEIYTPVEPLVPASFVPHRDAARIVSAPGLCEALNQWLKRFTFPQVVSIYGYPVTLTW